LNPSRPESSRTAEYVAFYRALETDEPQREPLFRDALAEAFLPCRLRAALRLARVPPLRAALLAYADRRALGARSSAICRTRFIDDLVRREAADGARQLVILGAGYDSRAHRLSELAAETVFEVDRRETQLHKRAILDRLARPTNRCVVYIEVDFQRDDLAARLAAAGWDRAARTTFVWEGVTNYLTERAVEDVVAFVGGAAPGGALVFTYVHRGVIEGSTWFDGGDKLLANVRRLGEPWTFGLDPSGCASFVARFGLAIEEDLGANDYRARYGWIGQRGYSFYRVALVRVAGVGS
jgi:methyltransferase (TIGR00027 family)